MQKTEPGESILDVPADRLCLFCERYDDAGYWIRHCDVTRLERCKAKLAQMQADARKKKDSEQL